MEHFFYPVYKLFLSCRAIYTQQRSLFKRHPLIIPRSCSLEATRAWKGAIGVGLGGVSQLLPVTTGEMFC